MIPDMSTEDKNTAELSPTQTSEMLRGAIGQIKFARNYTLELLANTPQELWFKIPKGMPTNVAWQVGHLAVSQYGLLMFRIRGRGPDDLELIPGKFRKAYGRSSVPSDDPSSQPTADELLARLAQVHEQSMQVLDAVTPEVLLEPVDMPYAAYPNKLGGVLFCPIHEGIHAGQLGILRRMHGLDPVR
tara:strand:- start:1220 stop:1780 length:561 start_codon:yes stop_codon:yes gene_type:complete